MYIFTEIKSLEKVVLGRYTYDETGALELSWGLTGFAVRFMGERAIIHFREDHCLDVTAYIKVEVDGRESKYGIVDGNTKIVLDGLGAGEHTLTLRRVSAGPLTGSNMPIKVSALEIHGDECEILPPPEQPKLKIQFFGDSITCGFGVLADPSTKVYRTFEEDASCTYAYMTAKALGADIRTCAISGQGVTRASSGERGIVLSEFFKWETRCGREPHDFGSWVPDIVVINIGTNDNGGGAPEDELALGARELLARMRAAYPDAQIFWLYGMMGQRYDAVLSSLIGELAATDKKLHYVPIEKVGDDEKGAINHPNLKGQSRGARVLTAAIREVMGK